MSNLEVLCVTMHQTDFSKIKEMNIRTDVVFANQADCDCYAEYEFDGHKAKMITSTTRGVGKNRNMGLLYASAEYCMLADDDVVYADNMPQLVVSEFEAHPDADVMIFHFESNDPIRKLPPHKKTEKKSRFKGFPWGGFNIAFRLSSVRKANVWFTTLFGGGCVFPSGEDSIFLTELRKAGLTFYVSSKTIGTVSFETSSWFTGYDEKYYYGKGAFYQAIRPRLKYFWMLYMAMRTRNQKALSFGNKIKWMRCGSKGYKKLISYADYAKTVCTKEIQ